MSVALSDLLNGALEDLGVIAPGETPSSAIQADALIRANQILDTLSAEGKTIPQQVMQNFTLTAGTYAYTFGPSGTWATTGSLRAMKVTAWHATSNNVLSSGGRPLSMAEFGELAKQEFGETTPIPKILGADTASPNINIRVFPPPSASPGSVEVCYWTPLANFSAITDTITFPQGFQFIIRALLAEDLWSTYPSQVRLAAIKDAAQRARAALITQNAETAPQPTPAAPQGQR
jgi:hypothetical protein